MTDQSTSNATSNVKKSSSALILLAWIVVSIPAAWGVYNTALNAMKLFTQTSTTLSGQPVK